jgi:hypothetical protein
VERKGVSITYPNSPGFLAVHTKTSDAGKGRNHGRADVAPHYGQNSPPPQCPSSPFPLISILRTRTLTIDRASARSFDRERTPLPHQGLHSSPTEPVFTRLQPFTHYPTRMTKMSTPPSAVALLAVIGVSLLALGVDFADDQCTAAAAQGELTTFQADFNRKVADFESRFGSKPSNPWMVRAEMDTFEGALRRWIYIGKTNRELPSRIDEHIHQLATATNFAKLVANASETLRKLRGDLARGADPMDNPFYTAGRVRP